MKTEQIAIGKIKHNIGQIDGLPKNPRSIKDKRYKKLLKSIQDDPEMLELRELIVFPLGEDYVAIAGNMRLTAQQELKYKKCYCKVLPADTPIEKLKAYTIKDNIEYGENDWDALTHGDWDINLLNDWGLPDTDSKILPHEQKEEKAFKKTFILFSFYPSELANISEEIEKIKANAEVKTTTWNR